MLTDIVYSDLVQQGPGTPEELAVRLHEHVLPLRAALAVLLSEGRVACVVASASEASTGTFFASDALPLHDAA